MHVPLNVKYGLNLAFRSKNGLLLLPGNEVQSLVSVCNCDYIRQVLFPPIKMQLCLTTSGLRTQFSLLFVVVGHNNAIHSVSQEASHMCVCGWRLALLIHHVCTCPVIGACGNLPVSHS
jgi:hypothetical protein